MDKNKESSYKLMHQEIAYKNVERSNNYKVGVADKFLINKVVDKVFFEFKKIWEDLQWEILLPTLC